MICTVSPPFAGLVTVDKTRGPTGEGRLSSFQSPAEKNFPKYSESFLTKPREIDWLFVFPQKGKIFENYFVRLIGTPNQNLKNSSGLVPELCK